MVYDTESSYLRQRSKEILAARKWGVSLISTLIGLGLFISEFQRIRRLPSDPLNYSYLVLFLITGVLIFSWIFATHRELELLFEWLDPKGYTPPSTIKETIMILSMALLLVALLFASRNPLWYSSIFAPYCLLDIFGGKYLQKQLCEAFLKSNERARADLEDEKLAERARLYLRGLAALEHYFLKRPHGCRVLIILICSLGGLVLSVGWAVTRHAILGLAAYALFIATLTTGEITIWRWRSARDVAMRPIRTELDELIRESKEDRH